LTILLTYNIAVTTSSVTWRQTSMLHLHCYNNNNNNTDNNNNNNNNSNNINENENENENDNNMALMNHTMFFKFII